MKIENGNTRILFELDGILKEIGVHLREDRAHGILSFVETFNDTKLLGHKYKFFIMYTIFCRNCTKQDTRMLLIATATHKCIDSPNQYELFKNITSSSHHQKHSSHYLSLSA